MELTPTRELNGKAKSLMVLAFAFLTGFMWRVRGSHGWGSMWGMFAVGVAMVLFIFAFFGNRKKMSYEAIPIAVILMGITNGGWGTLNSQMGGYLGSTVPFTGEEAVATVENGKIKTLKQGTPLVRLMGHASSRLRLDASFLNLFGFSLLKKRI